ncbi:hypothetical protein OQA88_11119 [Cercophora sp. LCS_1]
MFITLRNSGSGKQEKKAEMEQVARRNAVPGRVNDRVRAIRRTACVSCQAKKASPLRCTGAGKACDRCKSRSIECVFPVSRASASQQAGATNPTQQEPDNILFDAETGESQESGMTLASGSGTQLSSTGGAAAPGPVGVEPTADDFFSYVSDFDCSHAETGFDFNAFLNENSLSTDDPADFFVIEGYSPFPSASIPSLDSPSPSIPTPESATGSSSSSCSCTPDILRAIRQLDDDDFGLASLATDQVIQLQKYLAFQCFKPLTCRDCSDSATVSTLVFSLCDRMSEFFECMSRRLDRTRLFLDGHTTDGSHHSIDRAVRRTQLFCRDSGRPAESVECSLVVFSDEFRNQYSDEEQLHMIKVLLELQIRNYGSLLEKLSAVAHVVNSPARRARIKAWRERLSKATRDIEGSWASI